MLFYHLDRRFIGGVLCFNFLIAIYIEILALESNKINQIAIKGLRRDYKHQMIPPVGLSFKCLVLWVQLIAGLIKVRLSNRGRIPVFISATKFGQKFLKFLFSTPWTRY